MRNRIRAEYFDLSCYCIITFWNKMPFVNFKKAFKPGIKIWRNYSIAI
jgi:hypothetical protein